MKKIALRLAKLKELGAGDEQCFDCLSSQAPRMESMDVCKKCIADTPAFTALVQGLIGNTKTPSTMQELRDQNPEPTHGCGHMQWRGAG